MELDLALDVLIALQYLEKVDVFAAHLYQALVSNQSGREGKTVAVVCLFAL